MSLEVHPLPVLTRTNHVPIAWRWVLRAERGALGSRIPDERPFLCPKAFYLWGSSGYIQISPKTQWALEYSHENCLSKSLVTRENHKVVYKGLLSVMTQFINHDIITIFKTFVVNVRQCVKLPGWKLQLAASIQTHPDPHRHCNMDYEGYLTTESIRGFIWKKSHTFHGTEIITSEEILFKRNRLKRHLERKV